MPIASTTGNDCLAYVAVIADALAEDIRDPASGAQYCVASTGSATGPVRPTPLATSLTAARTGVLVIATRLRGMRNRVLFRADGSPVRALQVVDATRDQPVLAGVPNGGSGPTGTMPVGLICR